MQTTKNLFLRKRKKKIIIKKIKNKLKRKWLPMVVYVLKKYNCIYQVDQAVGRRHNARSWSRDTKAGCICPWEIYFAQRSCTRGLLMTSGWPSVPLYRREKWHQRSVVVSHVHSATAHKVVRVSQKLLAGGGGGGSQWHSTSFSFEINPPTHNICNLDNSITYVSHMWQ